MSHAISSDSDSMIELPLSIIDSFFNYNHVGESKNMLREIREQLFNKSYPHQFNDMEHDNVVYFFEKLEELIDAAFLLRSK
jgi:hypothetical protein